jgi:hypothetical protein
MIDRDIVVMRASMVLMDVAIGLHAIGLRAPARQVSRFLEWLLARFLSPDLLMMLAVKLNWLEYQEGRAE